MVFALRSDFTKFPPQITHRVACVITHPQYGRARELSFDVALIELLNPVQYTDKVRSICLPTAAMNYNQNPAAQTMLAAGWGSGGRRGMQNTFVSVDPTGAAASNTLKQATFTTVRNDVCANTMSSDGVMFTGLGGAVGF